MSVLCEVLTVYVRTVGSREAMEVAAEGAEGGTTTTEDFNCNCQETLIQLESLLEEDLNQCCHLNLGFEDNWCQLEPLSFAELSPRDIPLSLVELSPAAIPFSSVELSCAHIPLSSVELNHGDKPGSSAELIPADKPDSSTRFSHTDRQISSVQLNHTDEPVTSAKLGSVDRPVSMELGYPYTQILSAEQCYTDKVICPGLRHIHSPISFAKLNDTDRPLSADLRGACNSISSTELRHTESQIPCAELIYSNRLISSAELSHMDMPISIAQLGHEDRSVTSAEQSFRDMPICPAELGYEDSPDTSLEPSQSDRPASAELSHVVRSVSPAELSHPDSPISSPEPSYADRPISSAEQSHTEIPYSTVELCHSGNVALDLLNTESSNESRDHIDWSWMATLEVRSNEPCMSHDQSPRPPSAWLRSSMRRVRPFRLSDPPGDALVTPSTPLEPLATPDTVLDILSDNNRRPNSAPSGGRTFLRRDFPRRFSSYSATVLNSSVTNLIQGAEPVAIDSNSSEEEDLSSASEGVQTSGAEQARNNGNSTRQSCEPDTHSSPLGAWPHSLSSMLASLGCTLGLFNISRFAILSVHFGATFIVQFLFLTLLVGIPLFTLHACLGQCLGAGVIDMWHISPIFHGIGIALLVSQALIGIYSIVGVSWMFIYFRDSFITKQDRYQWSEPYDPYGEGSHAVKNASWNLEHTIPDYFSGVVLQRHTVEMPGSSFGHLKFQVAFNLAVVWMIIFVSLSKGLKSYGKVVYVFSLLPVVGMLVLCAKVLSLMPTNMTHLVFPETVWSEFFLNTKCWVASAVEVFLTWGLLGATAMQISSHNQHKHLLNRDTSLVVVVTIAVLLLTAFLANTCITILHSQGFLYVPSSFERKSTYNFLQPNSVPPSSSLGRTPVRYMTHTLLIAGNRVTVPGMDSRQQSGYQVLRLATELMPSTLALLGADAVSPFWAILFYFVLILFGIAQQLCIWHCIITGITAINVATLKSWETTITFFSCACGFVLGLPMTTELGIFVVHFLDYTIGCSWWITLLYLAEILAVFLVRGRPYSGETVVATLFGHNAGCLHAWAAPLLIFIWNVILPVALVVICIVVFKNGQFRDLYNWHSLTYSYWPIWARQVGCMLQILPIMLVPLGCIVQTWRYLSSGPPDILDRIQLLYRPMMTRHDITEPSDSPTHSVTSVPPVVTTTPATETNMAAFEDPPPKYTPPPSYTTATGARIAKILRQSFRRSMRRLAGALGDNSTLPAPPDYSAVLVEMNRTPQDHSELPEPSSTLPARISTMTAVDVAHILRSSIRHRGQQNRQTECLVDGAVPIHQDMAVQPSGPEMNLKPEVEGTSVT